VRSASFDRQTLSPVTRRGSVDAMTRRTLAPAAFLVAVLAMLVARSFGPSDSRSSDLRWGPPHAGSAVRLSGVDAPLVLRSNHGVQVSSGRPRIPGPRLPGPTGVSPATAPLGVALILLAASAVLMRRRALIGRAPSRSPPALLFA